MAFQRTAMGSCRSPQARRAVGCGMLFASGQRGFADGRGMVKLRKVCCKRGAQSHLFFLLSVSFCPLLTHTSQQIFLSPTPISLLYPFTVFRLLTCSPGLVSPALPLLHSSPDSCQLANLGLTRWETWTSIGTGKLRSKQQQALLFGNVSSYATFWTINEWWEKAQIKSLHLYAIRRWGTSNPSTHLAELTPQYLS